MRVHIVHKRLIRAAVAASAAALLAACGTPTANPTKAGTADDAIPYSVGMAVISDGSNVVQVGGRSITFPTTVTDAAFSPDGSRIAFVDGDGNIATARPDGKGLKVLTQKAPDVTRSHPTWMLTTIMFAERGGGTSVLKEVASNGSGQSVSGFTTRVGEFDAYIGFDEHQDPPGPPPGVAPSGTGSKSAGKEVAFERSGPSGEEVWVADLYQRGSFRSKVANGTGPALSADGTKVAYVDGGGNIEVLDTVTKGAQPVQVSFGVASPTHLSWTSDGRVAFSTPAGVAAVAANPASGGANPPVQLSSKPGVATFLPPVRDRVTRIAGSDPVEVAIAASQASWPTVEVAHDDPYGGFARAVLLTGTTNLPTMLAGSQMVDDGPILLTSGSTLDSRTAAEMKRVLGRVEAPFVRTVTIVGGTDVVSAQAESAVKAMGYRTERTTAPDPVTMAVTVSGQPSKASMVLLVDSADTTSYASAISDLGSYSQQTVLFTNGSTVPDGVKSFLNGVTGANAIVCPFGATARAALSSWAGKPALKVSPLDGTGDLLTRFGAGVQQVVLVDRSNLTDLITAIGLARRYGAPVLAVDPKAPLDEGMKAWLDGTSGTVDTVYIVDSKGAIGADLEHAVSALVAGPLGATSNINPKFAA
jgi:hypothetical protein